MNNIIDISQYIPLESDKFFFDTNVWLYLYGPVRDYEKERVKKYDGFLGKVLRSKASIYISSLVLSEIFHSWLKNEFNILQKEHPSQYVQFKRNFRNTQAYKNIAYTIKTAVTSRIMKIAQRIDDNFSGISLYELFELIENSDFNDNYYLTIAHLENFKIVTHDSDFAFSVKTSVSVLTANEKMLGRNSL